MIYKKQDIISIHAPPRGATARSRPVSPSCKAFQFTPLREGRRKASSFAANPWNFNSRPSARGDVSHDCDNRQSHRISIHAPPRGATIAAATGYIGQGEFQFTPLREGRLPRNYHLREATKIFQFTPLREGRLFPPLREALTGNFNSRPSARGDLVMRLVSPARQYFNSRPSARGDTVSKSALCVMRTFQFTPLREGRHTSHRRLLREEYFNSRPSARGDTQQSGCRRTRARYFNSRPSARGDFVAFRQRLPCKFQFTPLREGRLEFLSILDGSIFDFNSRPSARGDRVARLSRRALRHFNSRPSARGDKFTLRTDKQTLISIHAPPRGATWREV